MRDIILLIAVLACMTGGYFVVRKSGEFFDKHYKGFDDDDGKTEENEENSGNPLRKNQ